MDRPVAALMLGSIDGLIRQFEGCGIILGLEFNQQDAAAAVSRALYENGVWAIFSSLDKRVLQWKPGALLSPEMCREIMDRFDAAMPHARALLHDQQKATA